MKRCHTAFRCPRLGRSWCLRYARFRGREPRCAYWTASTPQPPEPRPTLSPYPAKPQHTAVGPVPYDSGSAGALFGGSQGATALSARAETAPAIDLRPSQRKSAARGTE